MAIIKCKECGKDFSSKASKCPHCGFAKSKFNLGCLGIFIIIIAFLYISGEIQSCQEKRAASIQKAKQAEIQEKIQQEKAEIQEKNREEEAAKKQEFVSSVENHYTNIKSLIDQKKDQEALDILSTFKKYSMMDYKDVREIYKTTKTKVLYEEVKKVPASRTQYNLDVYRELKNLNPGNEFFKQKYERYYAQNKKEQELASSDLHLLNWSWTREYDYAIVEGRVKNLTHEKIHNAMAVATWYDANGQMITYDNTYIDLTTLMPGQVSKFKIMERWNPAMKKASIEFTCRGIALNVYSEK